MGGFIVLEAGVDKKRIYACAQIVNKFRKSRPVLDYLKRAGPAKEAAVVLRIKATADQIDFISLRAPLTA
jgi:hypothetical protein